MSLINKLTEKSMQLPNADYLDSTLRYEVSRNESNKVVDLYSLDQKQLEWLLGINHIGNRDTSNLRYSILDDWYQVVESIERIQSNNNQYTISNVIGYELINDNQYIKLYYSHYVSNS